MPGEWEFLAAFHFRVTLRELKSSSHSQRTGCGRQAKASAIAISGMLISAAMATACKGASEEANCTTNRDYFEREVWPTFMESECGRCHLPGGMAVNQGSRFVLQNSSYPGFIDANLTSARELAKTSYEGTSVLLRKPRGDMAHGGGEILKTNSPAYKQLQTLVDRLVDDNEQACAPPMSPLAQIQRMPAAALVRKAALDLAGRLPTKSELEDVALGDDEGLDAALDSILQEPVFLERVREMYNDLLLTDRFLRYGGAALNVLDDDLYPGLKALDSADDARRHAANRAIAREPLDLIAYVVANDRPFSEVVTAQYTVVNPYSAAVYGAKIRFEDAKDPLEFQEAKLVQLHTEEDGASRAVAIPHAGVLSTPAFLNRWQTTPTNRNRARARRVYEFFLGMDVLKIATRPVDATAITSIINPTVNSEHCNVCHQAIDPLAGAFRGFDERNYERFNPSDEWHPDMAAPGFVRGQEHETMAADAYPKALQWLAPRLADDPRFALGTVYAAYRGLTGRTPLSYPDDKDPLRDGHLEAWRAQDSFFRDVADRYREGGENFKTVIKAIVRSPYYAGMTRLPIGKKLAEGSYEHLGMGRWLTPEQLNRRIRAVLDAPWRKSWAWEEEHDWLAEDYNVLYGGIDSEDITQRTREPNAMMSAVATRMANEMSCRVTAWDFTRPRGERVLFSTVELAQVPESAGSAVPGSEKAIRATLVRLHARLLGEELAANDAEIDRSFALFLETFRELETAKDTSLPWACHGRNDPNTGKDLPEDQRITEDSHHTLRAWQAVIAYLLSDWRFLTH